MSHQWWKEAVVYQIYPRSFMDSDGDGVGDLNGIASRLDYLKELGVDVVWLCPVYKSPNDDNGYDISDYFDIMDEFGTLEDWENLLAKMHGLGIKMIMDLVANHTSDEHAWFLESRKSKDNPYRDYYIWRDGKDGNPPNTWRSVFSFSAWERDRETGQYYLHLFSKKQPDLNWANEKVRGEIYAMMKFWLDKGIDGFRLDAIRDIGKPDSFETDDPVYEPDLRKTHRYLQEMNRNVLSKYDVMTVGEISGTSPAGAALFTAEDRHELNMLFHFEHMGLDGNKWDPHAIRLTDLKKVMSAWQTGLPEDAWMALYLDNHDQPRMVSRFGNDGPYREESATLLATMLHTMCGTPFIYQGDEIGMTNVDFRSREDFRDVETLNKIREYTEQDGGSFDVLLPALKLRSRDNARTPMQWDSSENAGFTSGTPWIRLNSNYLEINAETDRKSSHSIFRYYQKLIRLRKEHPILVYGSSFHEYFQSSETVYFYTRRYESQTLFVALNFSSQETTLTLPERLDLNLSEQLISNYEGDFIPSDETLALQPYQALVLLK